MATDRKEEKTAADMVREKPQSSAGMSQLKALISGGVGGMSLVVAGHPLDMIKVRLQTMAPSSGPQPSVVSVARQIVAQDGIKGLYRGMSAPLMGVTPIFAICFWAYDVGKDMMSSWGGRAKDDLTLFQYGVAGSISAIPTTAIMAPGERIKVLLQAQQSGGGRSFAGPGDVVKTLVKEQGVASLFRGSLATLLRDGVGSFGYFAVYEAIKRSLTKKDEPLSPLAVIAGGGFAGMVNWAVAIPFDTVKSRIQTAELSGSVPKGIVGTTRDLLAEGGPKSLFRGIGPAMARAFPANAACFLGMELSRSIMDKYF